jgi:D-alanyl-D-alanine dipeptidase
MARRRRVNPFSTLSRAGLVLIIMTLPAPALAGSALPKSFVYLRDIDPTIVQDICYAGSHNFVGRPIRGYLYLAAECIFSASAANALETVQRMLTEKKLSLIVWDCYRPKRAVEDFFQWSKDPTQRCRRWLNNAVLCGSTSRYTELNADQKLLASQLNLSHLPGLPRPARSRSRQSRPCSEDLLTSAPDL